VATELFGLLCPFPPHSTSVCQPLDVGVMGPLKAKLRWLWLEECSFERVTAAEKRKRMMERTIAVWDSISIDTVRSAFAKALPPATVSSNVLAFANTITILLQYIILYFNVSTVLDVCSHGYFSQ
jgi:hypothetical protein